MDVAPGAAIGVGQEQVAVLIVARQPMGALAIAPSVGGNLVKAEDTHQHHTHKGSCKKERFPAGLKGNILHPGLSALAAADVCYPGYRQRELGKEFIQNPR